MWVTGPLRDPVWAEYGVLASGQLAVLELAQVAGLTLVPPEQRDPTRTTTYGLGELLQAVCQEPIPEVRLAALLQFYNYPKVLRPYLRSTHPVEHTGGEGKH